MYSLFEFTSEMKAANRTTTVVTAAYPAGRQSSKGNVVGWPLVPWELPGFYHGVQPFQFVVYLFGPWTSEFQPEMESAGPA
jgi:hypothetical protein